MLRVLTLLVLASAHGTAAAQVLATGVRINPSGMWLGNVQFLQEEDTVHAFGRTLYSEVLYARSNDGGRHWPVQEVSLGTIAPGWEVVRLDSGALLVIGKGPHPNWLLASGPVVSRSVDNGLTWSASSLSTGTIHGGTGAEFAVDGDDVHVFWRNAGEIWTNRSDDGGQTWLPSPQLIPTGITPIGSNYALDSLDVVVDGPTIRVFWVHAVPAIGAGIVAALRQESLDHGVTWQTTASVVPVPGLQGGWNDIVPFGSQLFMVGGPKRYTSADDGLTWNPVTGSGIATWESYAMDGATILVAGRDAHANQLELNASLDGGQTWQGHWSMPIPFPMPSAAILQIVDDAMYCWWSQQDVFRSLDQGLTWDLLQEEVAYGFGAGPRRTLHATYDLSAVGNQTVVHVGSGSVPLGGEVAGTGGVAPGLESRGLCVQGNTVDLVVSEAIGGSVGVLGISTAPPAGFPVGPWTVWTQAPSIPFAFTTGGATGAAGQGEHVMPLAIPVSASIVGLELVSQALVYDPAAPGQFSSTGGMLTRLR